MKIKIALLDSNQHYLDRIAKIFSRKYSEELQTYLFSDVDVALQEIERHKIDVLIASEEFDIDVEMLPGYVGFAYFVDSNEIDMFKDQHAIGKYQKIDLIYQHILNIYSDRNLNISEVKTLNENCKVFCFVSPCGGVGTSTLAASAATVFSRMGKKTLYLNFENFGSADIFFRAEGQFDMSDVIYAIKSKKSNIGLKLESCVKQDESGVYFFSQPKVALDLMEMTIEEKIDLIDELQNSRKYDLIVLDMGFGLDLDSRKIYEKTDHLIWVNDGSLSSNSKMFKAYKALELLVDGTNASVLNRVAIIYNKFSNKTGQMLDALDVKVRL